MPPFETGMHGAARRGTALRADRREVFAGGRGGRGRADVGERDNRLASVRRCEAIVLVEKGAEQVVASEVIKWNSVEKSIVLFVLAKGNHRTAYV